MAVAIFYDNTKQPNLANFDLNNVTPSFLFYSYSYFVLL